MPVIELEKKTREALIRKLQQYFERELNQELGAFDAEFLLDFVTAKLGPRYYNQGLRDAATALSKRMDVLTEALEELERPEPRN